MPDALRFLISVAARIPKGIPARIPAGIPAKLGAALAAAVFLNCGIQVAGGTSEVGNPSNAITADNGKDGDTTSTSVGVLFNVTGSPIQIIRERKPENQASANDSASASTSASVSDTLTQSPAN
jgi:hypothetical protein